MKKFNLCLLILFGCINLCFAQIDIKDCGIYTLQNKNIILPAFTESSYKQSVYKKEVLIKKRFKEELRYPYNIYGEPIHIDSVYFLNRKKKLVTHLTSSDLLSHRSATLMEFTHKGNKVVYYFPVNYLNNKKHRNESYHFHGVEKKSFLNEFSLNPFWGIYIPYYDVDEINTFLSTYKDSVVVDTLINKEYILHGIKFEYNQNLSRKYNGLHLIVEDVATKDTINIPIIRQESYNSHYYTTSGYENEIFSLQYFNQNWIRKQPCIEKLNKESSAYINRMRNLIGDTIYIKNPNYLERIKMLDEYPKYMESELTYSSFIGSELEYIKAVLCSVDLKLITPERNDSNRNHYRYFARIASTKVNPYYNQKGYTNQRDTLFLQLNDDVIKQIMSRAEFKNLENRTKRSLKQESAMFNTMQKASYNYAVQRWGKKIADIVEQGEVRFGFTPEMCKEAYSREPYSISRVRLPIGYATMYYFHESNTRLYFIQNQLVAIQYPMSDIRYRKLRH